MRTMQLAVFILLAGSLAVSPAQNEEKLQSGPKAGAVIPSAFECYNVNGSAKGRQHCFVCRFGLNPAVILFAKEPAEGKDDVFNELLKQLEQTADDFQERGFGVGVVVLSPDARDSTNNADEEKTEELVKEAVLREKLVERITERAKPYKHVVIGVFPEKGPTKYNLNPKADVTIIFYQRMKIVGNYAFGADELKGADVERIVKRIREELPLRKKADAK
ncbi:MAG: hypothetical protein EXS16_01460 [Gemmataceae bacterium]|nr:hypothetical protein [Gemmataceae bacterium]